MTRSRSAVRRKSSGSSVRTTFALTMASELLSRRVVDRVTVVAPTEHLKTQWAEAAAKVGIPLDPTYSGRKGKASSDFVGVALTYAGVAANPLAHRIRTERFNTLVILDEVHHAGDALSWGEAVREAFDPARRRLALTGTPFRSDINPIPFVTYAPGSDGIPRSVADFTYGYGDALADHVVRPVLFMAYTGEMQWRTRAGDEVAARLGEPLTKDMTAHALRTALDPKGSWMPSVLAAADRRLSEVRRHVPDAGGLVIATVFTFLPGYPGLISSGFAGALLFAYMLMGLAIIHHVTRGKPQRPFILWGVYFLLLLFNSWTAAVIALLAIAEPISPLKRRPTAMGSPGTQEPDD